MNVKTLLISALTMVLTGCSTAPVATQSLTPRVSCCNDIHSVDKTALTVPFHQEVILTSHTQHIPLSMLNKDLVTTNDALVPVAIYELPDTVNNSQSDLFSVLLRSYIANDEVFAAKVLFMDSEWQIIDQHNIDSFKYYPTSLQGLERVEKIITLSPKTTRAQFMVVTTDVELLGHTLPRKHPEEVYAEQNNVIGQKHLPLTAQYSDHGRIDITTSEFSNSALLSMLAEFTKTSPQRTETDTAPTSKHPDKHGWAHYQSRIDRALASNNITEAANIVQEAGKAGHPQAKDYLLQHLAD